MLFTRLQMVKVLNGPIAESLLLSKIQHYHYMSAKCDLGWRRGVVVSGVGLINEVNRHRARLALGWVTAYGQVNHLGM